uniref:lantibiotic dehydratase family protein n=1 Tax=Chryseobacterium sp. TaxID=1871047 RepID=UPI0025C72E02
DLYSDEKKKLPLYWQEKIKKGISFLNKITPFQKESHFEKFKNAFYERFEAEEVSLAYALDTEIGIGYRQDLSSKGLHPYLEDLNLPHSKKDEPLKIHLDAVQQVLNEKLQNTLTNNQDKIELSDDDFKDIEECWNDLPDTFSCMAEIISENENEKLFLDGGGGSSAANLLGRFCSEKSDIHSLTKRITEKESELNAHYILAEIIHLPETRTGNVIRRPTLRSYEIPFLAQSVLPEENQILIEDLYISLKNNKIILRSKKLNKEIRPYLTNAHNYLSNSLPVYHFLCDIHSQNVRTGVYFSWGDLKHLYHFLPRVEYQNIIISKARWKITEKEINYLLLYKEDGNMLLNEIKEWRTKRKIPQWIQWVELDNRLTINLENYDLLLMFIHSIKHRKVIIIEEFLYNEHEDFRYEFIFPMYKEKALK